MRPVELAADDTPSADVVIHAADTMDLAGATIILLQPTSPLRFASDVAEATALYRTHAPRSVLTTGPAGKPNGAVYVIGLDLLKQTRRFDHSDSVLLHMSDVRSLDIDYPADLQRAADILARAVDWDG